MTPFWSMGGTSLHIREISVGEREDDSGFLGYPDGTVKKIYTH